MEALVDTLAAAGVEADVQEGAVVGEFRVSLASVTDEHGAGFDYGCQVGRNGRGGEIGKHLIRGGPVPVAHDEHRDIVVGRESGLCCRAALSRRPAHEALRAFGGLANKRLIHLNDALHGVAFHPLCGLQEPVAPAERGVERDGAALGGLPEARAVGERLSIGKPGIAAVQWASEVPESALKVRKQSLQR